MTIYTGGAFVLLPEKVLTNVLRKPPARPETPHDLAEFPLPDSSPVGVVEAAFNHELSVVSSRLKPSRLMRFKRLIGRKVVSMLGSILLHKDLKRVLYSISSLNVHVRRCMTPASNGDACSSLRFSLL